MVKTLRKKPAKERGDFVLDDMSTHTADEDVSDAIGANARAQLKAYLAQIERLEEDKRGVMEDIKEVYATAKSTGFDTKILRKVVAARRQDRAQLEESQALFDLYLDTVES